MRLSLAFFILLLTQGLVAQNVATDEPDFDVTIFKNGTYMLGDQQTSLKRIKKVFRDYNRQHNEMYVILYLENGVEYNFIEKFKNTLKKLDGDIVMEFADLDPSSISLSISGSIKDEFGNGLRNVSVIAKGSRKGMVTSENGSFNLTFPSTMKSLVIQHRDYRKIEVPYNDLLSMNLSNLDFTLRK